MGPEIDRFIYVKGCVFGRLAKTPNILASAIIVSIFIQLKLVSVFTVTISSNTINYRKEKWIFYISIANFILSPSKLSVHSGYLHTFVV